MRCQGVSALMTKPFLVMVIPGDKAPEDKLQDKAPEGARGQAARRGRTSRRRQMTPLSE